MSDIYNEFDKEVINKKHPLKKTPNSQPQSQDSPGTPNVAIVRLGIVVQIAIGVDAHRVGLAAAAVTASGAKDKTSEHTPLVVLNLRIHPAVWGMVARTHAARHIAEKTRRRLTRYSAI